MSLAAFLSGGGTGVLQGMEWRDRMKGRKHRRERQDRLDERDQERWEWNQGRQEAADERAQTRFDMEVAEAERIRRERAAMEDVFTDAADAARSSMDGQDVPSAPAPAGGRSPFRGDGRDEGGSTVVSTRSPRTPSAETAPTRTSAPAPPQRPEEPAPDVSASAPRGMGAAPADGGAPSAPAGVQPPPAVMGRPEQPQEPRSGAAPAGRDVQRPAPQGEPPQVSAGRGGRGRSTRPEAPGGQASPGRGGAGGRATATEDAPAEGDVYDNMRGSWWDDGLVDLLERGNQAIGRAGNRMWDIVGPAAAGEGQQPPPREPAAPTGASSGRAGGGGRPAEGQEAPLAERVQSGVQDLASRYWEVAGPNPNGAGPAHNRMEPQQPQAPQGRGTRPDAPLPTAAPQPIRAEPLRPGLGTSGRSPQRPEALPSAPTPENPDGGVAPEQLSQRASQAAEGSSPAVNAAVERTPAMGRRGRGAQRPMNDQQRDRAGRDFMDHYMEVGAPMVRQALIERGQFEKAQAFDEFLTQQSTKKGMEDWAQAMVSISTDDFDGFAENVISAYNRLDYFGDGTTVVKDQSGFEYDDQGEITNAHIVFRDEESGDTFEWDMPPEQMVDLGVTMLAPEEAFEIRYQQQQAASEARAGQVERQQDLVDFEIKERIKAQLKQGAEPNRPLTLDQAIELVESDVNSVSMTPQAKLATARELVRESQGAGAAGQGASGPPVAWRPQR